MKTLLFCCVLCFAGVAFGQDPDLPSDPVLGPPLDPQSETRQIAPGEPNPSQPHQHQHDGEGRPHRPPRQSPPIYYPPGRYPPPRWYPGGPYYRPAPAPVVRWHYDPRTGMYHQYYSYPRRPAPSYRRWHYRQY